MAVIACLVVNLTRLTVFLDLHESFVHAVRAFAPVLSRMHSISVLMLRVAAMPAAEVVSVTASARQRAAEALRSALGGSTARSGGSATQGPAGRAPPQPSPPLSNAVGSLRGHAAQGRQVGRASERAYDMWLSCSQCCCVCLHGGPYDMNPQGRPAVPALPCVQF